MESNLVDKTWSDSNNNIIKEFFNVNFPNFKLINETSHGPYWGVEYSNDEILVIISGDIGFGISIKIGSSKYDLWQFDRSVNEAMETNNNNINHQLNVLKRFLVETIK